MFWLYNVSLWMFLVVQCCPVKVFFFLRIFWLFKVSLWKILSKCFFFGCSMFPCEFFGYLVFPCECFWLSSVSLWLFLVVWLSNVSIWMFLVIQCFLVTVFGCPRVPLWMYLVVQYISVDVLVVHVFLCEPKPGPSNDLADQIIIKHVIL